MKLLFCNQAYGEKAFGGSETYSRMMAEHMAARGHEVHVVTSCAVTYFDWADYYEPGESELNGVKVHRFRVDKPRDHELFGALGPRICNAPRGMPLYAQEQWLKIQGPYMPGFEEWVWDNALNYDAALFFTYLYYPTVKGLPLTSGRIPTILHPLAHDESQFYFSIFDSLFKLPTGYVFLADEEEQLMHRRSAPSAMSSTLGIGVDLDVKGDASRFRQQYNLGDDPYIVCVGRLDPSKGSVELYDYFCAYKERHPSPLKLVLVGEPVRPVDPHPDVITTGFVPSQTKYDAFAGALVSMHPSYFESFSIVLTEAWAQSRPAMVNGHCNVLEGQAKCSQGAFAYRNFKEFESGLDILVEDESARNTLGRNGRIYVENKYEWNHVMHHYEDFISRVPIH